MLWLTLWPTLRLTLYIQERAGAPIHTAKNVFREREFAVLQFIDALNACSDGDVPADTIGIPLMRVNCNICLHKGIIFVNKVSTALSGSPLGTSLASRFGLTTVAHAWGGRAPTPRATCWS